MARECRFFSSHDTLEIFYFFFDILVISIQHFTTLGKFGLIAFQHAWSYECGKLIYLFIDLTYESSDSSDNSEGTCRGP